MKRFARIILLMCMVFLSVFTASGQSANFTADYTSGCAPLVVHFNNTSTGATSYAWDLGNGTTTSVANPSTSYLTPGSYTVKLTASNGSSSSVRTMIITVYPIPIVNFYANDTTVCPGTPVTFTSTSLGGVAGPLTYSWNFGDGYTSSASSPTHPYATGGNYNVTLSVINAQGCVSSNTRYSYVDVFTDAAVNFNAVPPYSCQAPATINFNNFTTGTAPLSYMWYFGDGGTSVATAPTHTYAATGAYTVRLIATDGNGCVDSLVIPSYVTLSSLTASFSAPSVACVNTPVTFTNTTPGTLSTTSWSFGDGGTSSTSSTTHTFSTSGLYTVRLIVSNGYCLDTVIQTISIQSTSGAYFVTTPSEPCPAPVSVTFNAMGVASSTSVTWLYGDGGTGTGHTSAHTYASTGVYTIKMIPVTSAGCRDTVTMVDTLYDLILKITDTPNSGCKPLTVNFSAEVLTSIPTTVPPIYYPYPATIATYTWDFGDGSPLSTAPFPSHTYTAVGVYTVLLTAITSNGCSVTDTTLVYVGTPPTVTFTATPLHVCPNAPVIFTATVTGPFTVLEWTFGDGTVVLDSTTSTVHGYVLPGVFSPRVVAYYNGCPSLPFTQTNYITVDSPVADFSIAYECSPPNVVHFTGTLMGGTSFLWMFGDGTTDATTLTPTHTYTALTTYTVKLVTHNATSDCRDTATYNVVLAKPTLDFVADDTTVCKGDTVHFTPSVTGGTAASHKWFVDGVFITDTAAIFTYVFNIPGWHTIKLAIKDNRGCPDTLIKTNYILVANPLDSFIAAPIAGCVPHTVTFTDHSTNIAGVPFTNYAWVFGDGASASVSTPVTTHTYTAAGTYDVIEIVTDNIGCKDTLTKLAHINVTKATASFTVGTIMACGGAPVFFTNTSTGAVSSLWFFGDGTTSTVNSPTHAYATPGIYTISLVVTDINGCTDTAVKLNYLTISKPTASFTMSDTASICPPMYVAFTNTSTSAVNYQWFFGDGNVSVLHSPNNMYITAASYTVTLVAFDVFGCTDTAYGHAKIFGSAGGFTYTPLTGCAPHTVYFNAAITNVPSIIWDFDDGTTSAASSATSITHTYTQPGAYIPRLVLSDGTGCQSSSPGIDTIKVNAVYAGFVPPPDICEFGSFTFTDTSSSYWSQVNSWFWTFNTDTSTLQSPTFTAGAAGTYAVTLVATDGWGCADSLVTQVTVYPPPVVDAGPDTIICLGDAATLLAKGATTYVWADGATLSCTTCNPAQATPPVVTTYTVTGTDIHGCVNTDTVTVRLKTKTISKASGDGEICSGQTLQLSDSGATKFTWYPPNWLDDPTSGHPIATPVGSLTYTVIAQLGSCIPDTNTITIIVHPSPTVDAGPDQSLVSGSTAQLHAVGANIVKYAWNNTSTLSCDSCADPVASMSVTTTYKVDVYNDYGCKATDSVTIRLYCDNDQVFIPNSFTPNGDGQNDVFYPRGNGVSNIKSFRIYNRWGELLFERSDIAINDVANAWDGSYGSAPPRPDVYVYIIEAICSSGKPIFIKGDITIIR